MSDIRIFLSRPHMSGAERTHVEEAFDSNYIAPLGPKVDEFEASVSAHLGGEHHCVALSSGTAALHLALRTSGIGAGDEVWVGSMTFAGGVFPVLYLDAVPRFFDVDRAHWTIDPAQVERRLHEASRGRVPRPRAIVVTDLYGQSVDLDPLERLCLEHEVPLIVDSAESLGARYLKGRPCGSGGDVAIISFNGNKIITTSGGGMLVTRSRERADEVRFLATQARDPAPHYQHSTYGYNYRLSNVSAAIGVGQMEVLEDRVQRRREIFGRYREVLEPLGVEFMPEPVGYRSTRWLTVARFRPDRVKITREEVRRMLLSEGIEARPLWKPMHLQPLFEGAPYVGQGFDVEIFEDGLCLPSGSDMTEDQLDEVVGRVEAALVSSG